MLKKSDYFYHLPTESIAQTPANPRDSAKLLCYNRKTDKVVQRHFRDCLTFLNQGDLLVVNTTKVIPARLFAKTIHGGKVEILLLKTTAGNPSEKLDVFMVYINEKWPTM